jgi:hypothetical protein
MTSVRHTRTRSRADTPVVSAADLAIHRRVCQQPTTDTSWSDRCTCRHVRGRHDIARHAEITTTTATGVAVCTGRHLAGPCLWPDCHCTGYTPPTTRGGTP